MGEDSSGKPRGSVAYAGVRIAAPDASSEAVRKSMKGNKRANTKPELVMRARLRAAGLSGYRLQWKVPGHPDIAWPGKKVALFVNGCFWHRCPHCHPSTPKSHVEYWTLKFERNVERDRETRARLEEAGWTVHVVWECQLRKKTIDRTVGELFPVLARELGKELVAPDDAAAEPRRSRESAAEPPASAAEEAASVAGKTASVPSTGRAAAGGAPSPDIAASAANPAASASASAGDRAAACLPAVDPAPPAPSRDRAATAPPAR